MKLSLNWLNEYVDVTEYLQKPQILANALTRSGLEVESVENKAEDFKNIVVGYIETKDKHPNADKLSLCHVQVGENLVLQIVCGAQNHKAHDKVIVALPEAVLPGDFKIKKSVIRGVESLGMLCSYKELGLTGDSEGIVILPQSAPVGASFATYAGLDDIILELKVTPNRADCLSHYGLARQIACLLEKPLKIINPEFKLSKNKTSDLVQVSVQNDKNCPRYSLRVIKNVKVNESPEWLKKRLSAVGLNSINNIVDITNFVMMELGQPLHAFDLNQLAQSKIRVENSLAGEKFMTLKESQLNLTGDELMIKDGEKSVAMAGVIGGYNSGVSDRTHSILLESAYFVSQTVRKSSRFHGIETDSAYRFSRGVDPEGVKLALDRATELIVRECVDAEAFEEYDFYPHPVLKHNISIELKTISDRLGYPAETDKFIKFMKGIGCKIQEVSNHFEVMPPTFRFDLETDMDLVEEYAILNGYENLVESLPPLIAAPTANDVTFITKQKLSKSLQSFGYNQAVNFAFTSEKNQSQFIGDASLIKSFGFYGCEEAIRLVNPLSEDIDVMKTVLSYGLFQNCLKNINYGNTKGQLFELGQCFYKQNETYLEHSRLAIVSWGLNEDLWSKSPVPLVYELKSHLSSVFLSLGFQIQVNQLDLQLTPHFLHPAQSAEIIFEGEKIGFFGHVHPGLLDANKIRQSVVLAELNLAKLMKPAKVTRSQSVSKFPSVERDFAFIMKERQSVGPVLKEIKKLAGGLLKDLVVFDVYVGDKLEAGTKSVALRLKLQEDNGTLQDATLNELSLKITSKLAKDFDAHLR